MTTISGSPPESLDPNDTSAAFYPIPAEDLDRDIEYISRLHDLRRRAGSLVHRGLRGVLLHPPARSKSSSSSKSGLKAASPAKPGAAADSIWEQAHGSIGPDVNEPMHMRRLKHLAHLLGIGQEEGMTDAMAAIEDLSRLPDLRDVKRCLFQAEQHEVPLLFAANYLRTALDDYTTTRMSAAMFWCYYRLVLEMYFVQSPDFSIGGVRANPHPQGTSLVSAFVTWESARSIRYWASKLEQTRTFLRKLRRCLDYARRVATQARAMSATEETNLPNLRSYVRLSPSTPAAGVPLEPQWCELELDRLSTSMRCLAIDFRARVLFPMPEIEASTTCFDLAKLVADSLSEYVLGSGKELAQVVKEVKRDGPRLFRKATDEHLKHILNEGALERALSILTNALSSYSAFSGKFSDPTAPGGTGVDFSALAALCKYVENELDKGARAISILLRPVEAYASGLIHRAVFGAHTHQVLTDASELAFSAATAGSLSGNWKDPLFVEALGLLERSIDERGSFAEPRAFHLGAHGAEYSTTNAQVLRALAQVMEHVQLPPSVGLVERMVRHFEDNAIKLVPGGDKEACAWGRGIARREPLASIWGTTVSLLALHRIGRMLDRKIDDRVKQHFTVRTTSLLKEESIPRIDELMCTDIGLAVASKGLHPRRYATTHYLEFMRAHLMGPRAEAVSGGPKVHSMILYGPPGTGKTTLLDALARTHGCDLLYITPCDFLVKGTENLERRATSIMRSLTFLRNCVILFDEFDTVLHSREATHRGSDTNEAHSGRAVSWDEKPSHIFHFLPGSMLPKFAALNKAAGNNRVVYALATNYYHRLDQANIRPGRFDHAVGVYCPDLPSRICRLVSQMDSSMTRKEDPLSKLPEVERIVSVLRKSQGLPTVVLAKRSWLTAPKRIGRLAKVTAPESPWEFLCSEQATAALKARIAYQWPMPEKSAASVRVCPQIDADTDERAIIERRENRAVMKLELNDSSDGTDWPSFISAVAERSDSAHEELKQLARDCEEIRRLRTAPLDVPFTLVPTKATKKRTPRKKGSSKSPRKKPKSTP